MKLKLENVFIKIDVEGMEIEVLNETKNLINKNRSSIFVEVNEKSILKGIFFPPIIEKYEGLENLLRKLIKGILKYPKKLKKIKFSKNNFNLLII